MVTQSEVLSGLVEGNFRNNILFLDFLSGAFVAEHLSEFEVGGGIGGFRRHGSFYIK